MHVWVKASWDGIDGSRQYASERAMKSALSRLLKKRSPGPMAYIEVFSKYGPYSGPDQESYVGRMVFDGDGSTPIFCPAGTL